MFLMLLLKMKLRLFAATTLAAAMAALTDSAMAVSLSGFQPEQAEQAFTMDLVQLGSEETALHKMAKDSDLIEETDPKRKFKDLTEFAEVDKHKA